MRWMAGVAMVVVGACAQSDAAEADDLIDDDLPMPPCSTCAQDSAAADDLVYDDLPMSQCSGSGGDPCRGGSEDGLPAGFPCEGTADCAGATVCLAPFVDGEIGAFACSTECISLEDETQWCMDAGACCDPSAVCTSRGYCVTPAAAFDDLAIESGNSTGDATSTG